MVYFTTKPRAFQSPLEVLLLLSNERNEFPAMVENFYVTTHLPPAFEQVYNLTTELKHCQRTSDKETSFRTFNGNCRNYWRVEAPRLLTEGNKRNRLAIMSMKRGSAITLQRQKSSWYCSTSGEPYPNRLFGKERTINGEY